MSQSCSIEKSLYSDAGSGIVFNFADGVKIGEDRLPEGILVLPIAKQAKKITLSSGAKLAGLRFHPAISYGLLGVFYDKPTLLPPENDQFHNLYSLYSKLALEEDNHIQIEMIKSWVNNHLDFTNVIPDPLQKALDSINQEEPLEALSERAGISQRHVERLFQLWLGMTPKHYQRILRVKKSIYFLSQHQDVKLADVAYLFGFSDQAHMTREFNAIACVTPKKV